MRPDGKPAATLIPEAFGHAGHNLHTWTGGWGTVTYWNAYVANLELNGQGNFYDPRLMNAEQFPIAAKAGLGKKKSAEDKISDKLAALQFYQLAIPAPKPPKGSFNEEAAGRGKILFNEKAQCASCHVPPLFTEPGYNAHKPEEIGIDDFQANRSPDKTYVTQGLKGLWIRKRGFYHDGRFATLLDVINHYDNFKKLGLTDSEKTDLVEYLKSSIKRANVQIFFRHEDQDTKFHKGRRTHFFDLVKLCVLRLCGNLYKSGLNVQHQHLEPQHLNTLICSATPRDIKHKPRCKRGFL